MITLENWSHRPESAGGWRAVPLNLKVSFLIDTPKGVRFSGDSGR
jgi:hypothetical protein